MKVIKTLFVVLVFAITTGCAQSVSFQDMNENIEERVELAKENNIYMSADERGLVDDVRQLKDIDGKVSIENMQLEEFLVKHKLEKIQPSDNFKNCQAYQATVFKPGLFMTWQGGSVNKVESEVIRGGEFTHIRTGKLEKIMADEAKGVVFVCDVTKNNTSSKVMVAIASRIIDGKKSSQQKVFTPKLPRTLAL